MSQLSLFPEPERPRICIIDGEEYASVLDLLRIYGKSGNPDRDWKRIKDKLKRQGYEVPNLVLHQFFDVAGKLNRATPIVNKTQIARIAQITDYPEWEPIRQRMAEIFIEHQEQHKQRSLAPKTYRALRNAGYSHDRAQEWHDLDRHGIEAHNRAVREWIERHGNIGHLTNAVTRIVLGQSATTWKREHDTEESPRRYMSSVKKAALAIVEDIGAILHRRRHSDGTEELLVDIKDASQVIDWDKLDSMLPDDDLLPPSPKPQQRRLPSGKGYSDAH